MTGYPHMAHWEYVEGPALRTNAVPVIIGYALEYREDMEVDAEGPLIEFQLIHLISAARQSMIILLSSMVLASTVFLTTPMNHISMRPHKSSHLAPLLMME